MLEAGLYRSMPEMPGAREGMERLIEVCEFMRFKLVTSTQDVFTEHRLLNLAELFPNLGLKREDYVTTGAYDPKTFEGRGHVYTKGPLVKELGAAIHVDDLVKHVQAAKDYGVMGILFGEQSRENLELLPSWGLLYSRSWKFLPELLLEIYRTF